MKTTVIYHSADYDGIFCREIAKKFLSDAEFIGWNFGDAKILFPEGLVYVMDLSPECLEPPDGDLVNGYWQRLIWIDHHKTSIEKWCKDIPGYRIDGVAACRLAWQWFSEQASTSKTGEAPRLPEKQHFIDRSVTEPLAVRLAGEYDIWDRKWMAEDDNILRFQYGLKAYRLPPFDDLLDHRIGVRGSALNSVLDAGIYAQSYAETMDAFWLAEAGHILEWESLRFLAKNTVERGSNMFLSKDVLETGHDALLVYGFRGKLWTVSLYHAKHRTDLDLSEIAKKHGGGGHRGACGFTCKTLPFTL